MKSRKKVKEARLVYLERAPDYHYMAQCVDWLKHESWREGVYSMIMKDTKAFAYRDRMFKLLRTPGIDSKESVPPAYAAWRAGTTTLFLFDS
jgi:hypothetical protein